MHHHVARCLEILLRQTERQSFNEFLTFFASVILLFKKEKRRKTFKANLQDLMTRCLQYFKVAINDDIQCNCFWVLTVSSHWKTDSTTERQ